MRFLAACCAAAWQNCRAWHFDGKTPCCRYEALQLGSVPVYVWDYDIIVPYQELLNWNEVSPKHTAMHPGRGMECIWLTA